MGSMGKLGFKLLTMESAISFPLVETTSVTLIWLRESSTVLNSPISLTFHPSTGTPKEIRQLVTLIIPSTKRNDLYNHYHLKHYLQIFQRYDEYYNGDGCEPLRVGLNKE